MTNSCEFFQGLLKKIELILHPFHELDWSVYIDADIKEKLTTHDFQNNQTQRVDIPLKSVVICVEHVRARIFNCASQACVLNANL